MRIADISTVVVGNPWKNWVLVRLTTDSGLVGWGEATGGLQTMPVVHAIEEMRPLYLGADPREVHDVWQRMHRGLFLHTNAGMAGIETACWDVLAKSLGVPLWRLLGGRADARIRAYANGWYRGPREPDAFAERARQVVAMGYTALKFDPFGANQGTLDRAEEDLSLAIVAAVRDAIGDSADLIVEAHDRFTVSTAIRVGRALEAHNPLWLETPVMSTDVEATLEVARQVPVPVAAGERFDRLEQFSRLAAGKVVSILQPEFLSLGGISPTIKAAAIAEAHGAVVAPHSAQSPVCTAINVQLGAVLPNLLIQETFDDFQDEWAGDVVKGAPRVVDGHLELPDRPGLGIDVDDVEAARHPYGDTNFLRLFEPGWERRGRPAAGKEADQ
ncbi:MAG TPA: mandelate racemase/muconate lactonizing enzyme family protein [Candidatus Dormibacteraeota bacterium]|jgi:galactonate dehydratase|nr:mandelate racemase/muconate lactonizing enzyme family protein [Candidatus Dormibacteraeota bacterium]